MGGVIQRLRNIYNKVDYFIIFARTWRGPAGIIKVFPHTFQFSVVSKDNIIARQYCLTNSRGSATSIGINRINNHPVLKSPPCSVGWGKVHLAAYCWPRYSRRVITIQIKGNRKLTSRPVGMKVHIPSDFR